MRDDELFQAAFEGELTAEHVRDLREALQRRLTQVRAARERGELVDADWADDAALARQVAVLQEEELIGGFVEDGLEASLRRAEILRRLGEAEE